MLEQQIETVLTQKEDLDTQVKFLEEDRLHLNNDISVLTTVKDDVVNWKESTIPEWEHEKKLLLNKIAELEESIEAIRNASSDSDVKIEKVNDKFKNDCEDLLKQRNLLKKQKDDLENTYNAMNKTLSGEKKDREKLEEEFARKQIETGSNLVGLRKKLQQYVWEDMYSWKVLLDIKTDFTLEDLHEEKWNQVLDLEFRDQMKTVDEQIQEENNRLVELKGEKQQEEYGQNIEIESPSVIVIKSKKDKKKKKR